MTSPTIIHLVRHGEVHNPDQVLYGRLPDFRLSERGREQAQAAGEVLKARPLTALFSSPQPRTQETAGFIRAHHNGLSVHVDPRIDELHTPHEGQPLTIFQQEGFDLYGGVEPPYDTPATMLHRTREFIAHVRAEYAGREVAAVSHGDIIVFMFLFAHGHPPESHLKRQLGEIGLPEPYPATASISTFAYHTDDPDELPVYTYQRPYPEALSSHRPAPR